MNKLLKELIIKIVLSIFFVILCILGIIAFLNSEFYYNKILKISNWNDRVKNTTIELKSHYYPKEEILKAKVIFTGLDKKLIQFGKEYAGDTMIMKIIFVDKHDFQIMNKEILLSDLIEGSSDKSYNTDFVLKINKGNIKK